MGEKLEDVKRKLVYQGLMGLGAAVWLCAGVEGLAGRFFTYFNMGFYGENET
jgi:hypothetical protein